jgi:hypothetical protein
VSPARCGDGRRELGTPRRVPQYRAARVGFDLVPGDALRDDVEHGALDVGGLAGMSWVPALVEYDECTDYDNDKIQVMVLVFLHYSPLALFLLFCFCSIFQFHRIQET